MNDALTVPFKVTFDMSHKEESDNGDDYAQNSKGKTESKGGHYPRRF
jgi:hypothetical protein